MENKPVDGERTNQFERKPATHWSYSRSPVSDGGIELDKLGKCQVNEIVGG